MEPPPQAKPPVDAETVKHAHTPISDDHDDNYGVPTLEELGIIYIF